MKLRGRLFACSCVFVCARAIKLLRLFARQSLLGFLVSLACSISSSSLYFPIRVCIFLCILYMFYMYNSTLLSVRSLRITEHGIYISEAMPLQRTQTHICMCLRDKRRTFRLVNDAKIHKQNHLCQWLGTHTLPIHKPPGIFLRNALPDFGRPMCINLVSSRMPKMG